MVIKRTKQKQISFGCKLIHPIPILLRSPHSISTQTATPVLANEFIHHLLSTRCQIYCLNSNLQTNLQVPVTTWK